VGFIVRVIVNAVALGAAAWLLPGISYGSDVINLLLVAALFGVLNAIVRPILGLLTCPLQILTLGLFTLVLNAGMLLLLSGLSGRLGLEFTVDGWLTALIGGIIVTVVSIILSLFVRDNEGRRA
jgi:putative membrane protein